MAFTASHAPLLSGSQPGTPAHRPLSHPAPTLRRSAACVLALISVSIIALFVANSRAVGTIGVTTTAVDPAARAAAPCTPPRIAIVVLAMPPAPRSGNTTTNSSSELARASSDLLWASVANKRAYADLHNYALYVVPAPLQRLRSQAVWDKLAALHAVFEAHPEHEWLWMLDLDTFVVNLDRHLEDVVALAEHQQRAHNRTVDLMIARDCNGINAGSMLLRRSAWTARLLARMWSDEWASVPNLEKWQEQAVLAHLHATDADVRDHTLFAPQRAFNAYTNKTDCGESYQVFFCCVLFGERGRETHTVRPDTPPSPPKKTSTTHTRTATCSCTCRTSKRQ